MTEQTDNSQQRQSQILTRLTDADEVLVPSCRVRITKDCPECEHPGIITISGSFLCQPCDVVFI